MATADALSLSLRDAEPMEAVETDAGGAMSIEGAMPYSDDDDDDDDEPIPDPPTEEEERAAEAAEAARAAHVHTIEALNAAAARQHNRNHSSGSGSGSNSSGAQSQAEVLREINAAIARGVHNDNYNAAFGPGARNVRTSADALHVMKLLRQRRCNEVHGLGGASSAGSATGSTDDVTVRTREPYDFEASKQNVHWGARATSGGVADAVAASGAPPARIKCFCAPSITGDWIPIDGTAALNGMLPVRGERFFIPAEFSQTLYAVAVRGMCFRSV